MCVCLHVYKVYQIKGSIVGRSKEDKTLTLLTYMGMCVCVCVRACVCVCVCISDGL